MTILTPEREGQSGGSSVSVWEAETGPVGCRRKSWLQKCVTYPIYLPAVKNENRIFWGMEVVFPLNMWI